MGYSVGIGLTNDCNLSCAHCYRDVDVLSYVSLAQVKVICESLPVDAVGMGTGENALHPQFAAIVDYLAERGLPMSMASNGHSILSVPSETLRQFRDLEVSIDYPTQAGQDGHRGPGSWRTVHEAIERCHALGITVTVLTTLMSTNYRTVGAMVGMARRNGANLRVNVYQPVHTSAFTLSFEQFWEAFGLLYAQSEVISCSEPVVRAAMGLGEALSPCGHRSIRVNPLGEVIPCVYWPVLAGEAARIEDLPRIGEQVLETPLFARARSLPRDAADCRCRGGCAARRALLGNLDAHDRYCPWARGQDVRLEWTPAPAAAMLRSGNVCTTLVM